MPATIVDDERFGCSGPPNPHKGEDVQCGEEPAIYLFFEDDYLETGTKITWYFQIASLTGAPPARSQLSGDLHVVLL